MYHRFVRRGVVALAVAMTPLAASAGVYIKVGDGPWLKIQALSWGSGQRSLIGTPEGGAAPGKATVQDVTITGSVSAAKRPFKTLSAGGRPLSLKLLKTSAGGPAIKFTLEDA